MSTDNDLTDRERAILTHIVRFRKDNLGLSPTTREIFDHLQETLPKRKRGRNLLPPLVSLVQVTRSIDSLRAKGMLVDPHTAHPELFGKSRNLIPTKHGESVVRE